MPYGREFALLLACCSVTPEEYFGEKIDDLLQCPLDWAEFTRLLEHHRVLPQIYSRLSQFSDSLPPSVMSYLRSAYREHACRCLWFTEELARVVEYLGAHGVAAAAYKGPVLAKFLYGDTMARQFSDLDMLIAPADVVRARTALADLGYEPNVRLTPRQEEAYIESGYEYSFDGKAGKNLLELQWRVLPHFYSVDLDVTDLLTRTIGIDVDNHSFRTLGPEDLLPVLCLHAAKHVWTQLSWLCDIAQLVRLSNLNWNATLKRVEGLGLTKIVAITLGLTREFLGSALPSDVERWLLTGAPHSCIADQVMSAVVRSSHYDTESMAYFRLMLQFRERWSDRSRFLWRLVTTPSVGEWSTVRLPSRLVPLYRVVRAYRLTKRLATSA